MVEKVKRFNFEKIEKKKLGTKEKKKQDSCIDDKCKVYNFQDSQFKCINKKKKTILHSPLSKSTGISAVRGNAPNFHIAPVYLLLEKEKKNGKVANCLCASINQVL